MVLPYMTLQMVSIGLNLNDIALITALVQVVSFLATPLASKFNIYKIKNKIQQSVSGCQNHIVSETTGLISIKFVRKDQLNQVDKIA